VSAVSTGQRLSHATHRGRRSRNQDAVLARELADGRTLVAVADGMGGHAAGEVASETALSALVSALESGAALAVAVRHANAAVHALSTSQAELEGMGTTLVALLRNGESYQIANVGDSRAYRVRSRSLEQITADHSFVAEGLRAGTLSAEEAERSPWRHALTRSLGTDAEVEVDLFGPFSTGGEPHAVLLCSDGLHQVLPPERLLEWLDSEAGRAHALERLPEEAYRAGGTDNITAALIEFGLSDVADAGAVAAVPQWETPTRASRAPAPMPGTPRVRAQRGRREVIVDAAPAAALAAWRAPPRRRSHAFSWERMLFLLCASSLVAWMGWFVANLLER
jgi:protein phosphatase